MRRTILFILVLSVTSICFAQSNQTESLTISTYYPSPYGVYGILKLNPRPKPATCNEGELTYDNNLVSRGLYYCNSTNQWSLLAGNGGGGYWQLTGTNINNTNSGNVGIGTGTPGIADLNVANQGASVGLYVGDKNLPPYGQAMVEINPPAGATHIWASEAGNRVFSVMAGGAGYFAGTVYVNDVCISGTSVCLSSAGNSTSNSTTLVGGFHTVGQCLASGGTPFASDSPGLQLCKFPGGACLGGLSQYKSFGTSTARSCGDTTCSHYTCSGGTTVCDTPCTTPGGWGNPPVSCTAYYAGCDWHCVSGCWNNPQICMGGLSEIGCY